jgi:imidazolonepropionase-like amidohydrolase
MTPGVDPRSPSYTEAELTAGVEEAHKAFRVVGAHAQATEGIKNAIRAGVDSIEHGVWLDEEAIGLMMERGTCLVATLTAPFHIAHGAEAGIPAYMVEKGQQVLEDHIASFRAATRVGVRLAMGTDQGTPLSRPGENAQEILRLAEHGLSSAAAIMAATAWAADLLKIDAGRISEGLFADFAVFENDPLSNLAVLADGSLSAVIGRRHRPASPPLPLGGHPLSRLQKAISRIQRREPPVALASARAP